MSPKKRLIHTDENTRKSSVYIGYLILKMIKKSKDQKVIFLDLIKLLKKDLKIIQYRQVIFALSFLYSLGLIDFSEPYIYALQ
jgi:hypothetical protein